MRITWTVAFLVAVTLVGDRSVDAGRGQDPKVLAYTENTYAVLDPAWLSVTQPNHERLLLVLLEPLTTLDPKSGEVKPGTAASWTQSDDGRTWTFKIREGAKWDRVRDGASFKEGGAVTAHDFVRSWKRTLDPYKPSPWASLFDGIQGCREITVNSQKVSAFSELRRSFEALIKQYPSGVPGDVVNESLDELGVRPFLVGMSGRSVKLLQNWKDDDTFQPERIEKVIKDLKKARRKAKREGDDAIDAFGTAASGVHASDDQTLVVKTRGVMPFLPELLARACFAPIHESYKDHRNALFGEWRQFVSNGPYRLKGRGPKPAVGRESERILSPVHLEKNPNYDGPNAPQMQEIFCMTGQGAQEDLVSFKDKDVQQVFFTWLEYPTTGDRKRPETNLRKKFEDTSGFKVRPTSTVVFLRFRCTGTFASKEKRRAVAMTIDRATAAKQFWPPAKPIDRIVPEGVRGRMGGVQAPNDSSDKKAIEQALEKAGIDEDHWLEVTSGESSGEGGVVRLLMHDWKKTFSLESGERIETAVDLARTIRNGAFQMLVSAHRGYVNDPFAYLAVFHSANPDGGTGWRDPVFDALIDAAQDPAAALADKERFCAKVDDTALAGALSAATNEAGRERFRQQALAKAEQRLLDEYVIVPLCVMNEGFLGGRLTGLGSDAAWQNPAFVGSLWNAKK